MRDQIVVTGEHFRDCARAPEIYILYYVRRRAEAITKTSTQVCANFTHLLRSAGTDVKRDDDEDDDVATFFLARIIGLSLFSNLLSLLVDV